MNGKIGLQGTCLPSHSFTHEKKSDQKEESLGQGPAARKENNLISVFPTARPYLE